MIAISLEMLWRISIKGQWIITWSRVRQLFGTHCYCCTLRYNHPMRMLVVICIPQKTTRMQCTKGLHINVQMAYWLISFTNFNAQFLYSLTICMLHYNPRHVSSINMPIFRRTNCVITASGIVTFCTVQYSTVCRIRADCSAVCSHPAYCTAVYREWRYQMLW